MVSDRLMCNVKCAIFRSIMARRSYIRWDDNNVRIRLDQHDYWDFYSASWLKHQSAVYMLLHLNTFPNNQSLLFLLIVACLAEKQRIPILLFLVWPNRCSNPWSTTLELSTLTITPPRWFTHTWGYSIWWHILM